MPASKEARLSRLALLRIYKSLPLANSSTYAFSFLYIAIYIVIMRLELEQFHYLSLHGENEADEKWSIMSGYDNFSDASNMPLCSVSTGNIVCHGRSYPAFGETWSPNDTEFHKAIDAFHLASQLRLAPYSLHLFRSPVTEGRRHILDVGAGSEVWPDDVSDMFLLAQLTGVDLSLPWERQSTGKSVYEIDDVT